MTDERALVFDCDGDSLVAIAHLPDMASKVGVLVVVGGPQYRVGSHRQFALLGRSLARHGIQVFRFDHRGIGDSEGSTRNFLTLDEDIRRAVDTFFSICPEMQQLNILGLCDAASAALLYAHRDSRVSGLILANPWVRSEAGLAKAFLKTYYAKKLRDPNFWSELVKGRHDIWRSLSSLIGNLTKAIIPQSEVGTTEQIASPDRVSDETDMTNDAPFPVRMLSGLRDFDGRVLFILSGDDLTAAEFRDLVRTNRKWRMAVGKSSVTWFEMPEATHTFSTRRWRDEVADQITQWVQEK